MTNYKRFVSYFYQYDSGRKINNTGYARIETSDEMCKVSLNCNLRTIPGRVCRVYFVKRNRDQTEGILTGTAITKADGVEARVTMPRGVMEDTKVRFYDITGIVVCFSKDNYFVTEWDNIPITYHQVSAFEAKNTGNKEEVKDNVETTKQPSTIEVVDTKSEMVIEVVKVQPETTKLENNKVLGDVVETKEKIEYTGLIGEDVVEEEAKVDEDKVAVTVGEATVEIEDGGLLKEDLVEQEKVKEEVKLEQSIKLSLESEERELKAATIIAPPSVKEEVFEVTKEVEENEEAKGSITEEEFMVSSIEAAKGIGEKEALLEEDELVLDDNDEMVNAANCNAIPSLSEKEGWCDHPSARSILDRFPHMYPFDDGEITECVRIEPKDLGLLPIDAWVLGNNSFILHSFSAYRHLLFAKKMSREGIYYMVMVPGAYNAREKHMAGMFGFKDFKCSRRRKLRDGDFGYWYIYIDYSNNSTC
ncbi:hypothetical protein [Lachnoclostridium phytofermentans]|uniref:hypothetical protein n=1 Tax=Lachnoclostridium phytofermentans TaxID=66219 RepID=UPI00068D0CD4|nr:hypothetical protein [Lachnoclostridium phytofermentans]